MAGRFTIDSREYDATMQKYVEIRMPKDVTKLLNSKAIAFLSGLKVKGQSRRIPGVIPETKSAAKKDIRGKLSRVKFHGEIGDEAKVGTMAMAIVQSRRKKKGLPLFTQTLARRVARTMTRARVRARGYMKSGWLWALKPLIEAQGKTFRKNLTGRSKGEGSPARIGKAAVLLRNEVRPAQNLPDPNRAMKRAFKGHIADMKVYIENRLRQGIKEIKGRRRK